MRADSTFKKSLQKAQFEEKRKIGSSSKTNKQSRKDAKRGAMRCSAREKERESTWKDEREEREERKRAAGRKP